jgi:hypothetical protein
LANGVAIAEEIPTTAKAAAKAAEIFIFIMTLPDS